MFLKVFFRKSILKFVLILSAVFAVAVFAYTDKTNYALEQIIIVPDQVQSDSWQNVENALVQDISIEAIFQQFSQTNSAFLKTKPNLEEKTQVQENSETGSDGVKNGDLNKGNAEDEVNFTEEENGSEEKDTVESDDFSSANNNNEQVEENDVDEKVDNEVEAVENVAPTPSPVVEELSFGVFPKSVGEFLFTQEVFATSVTTSAEISEEVEKNVSEPEFEALNDLNEEEGENLEDNEDDGNIDDVVSLEELKNIKSSNDNEGLSLNEGEVDNSETLENDEVVVFDIRSDCKIENNCETYSSTFSGFAMPEFSADSFLTSAQLRLSLAAKTKTVIGSGLQRFVVEYHYEKDSPWQVATIIDVEGEVSNALNGGYFLVSLDKPSNQVDLSRLEVRISYQGNIEQLEEAFVEGIWLEVNSARFYEEEDPNFAKDMLDYDRELELPKFHTLHNTNTDIDVNKLPVFTLSYSPQQNFLKRAVNYVFSNNTYSLDRVRLTNKNGEVVEMPVAIKYFDDLTWTISFLKQPQKLLPGKYRLELYIDENNTIIEDSFEFYWGVLAVNTNKSIYSPNEEVKLSLAALTDKGDTICDADLYLQIIDPSNTFREVEVLPSGMCGKNNVTDVPDYSAFFTETEEVGLYKIQLEHRNREGVVVHKIQDSFEVRDFIPFDIERIAPTRIYPPVPYKVDLNITANQEFKGDIVEKVPKGFVLVDAGGADIITGPDAVELVWSDVVLEENEELKLSYVFDAPDISPYTYLLGPLNMDGFQELRQWQIASDALNAVASLRATETLTGTNLNTTPSPLIWSSSTLDNLYFNHSTSTNPERLTIRKSGDYEISVMLPVIRTSAGSNRTRIGVEVRVNGVAVPEGAGRSSYISNSNGHNESNSSVNFLLTSLKPDDYIEVFVEGLTTISVSDIVEVSGVASAYVEYIPASSGVFSATTTRTTASTSLNQTASQLTWTETRQDTGFIHSDAINPEQIIISNPGTYLVYVNVPLTGDTNRQAILGKVNLDGTTVPGGVFSQGYMRPGFYDDFDSSIHWSGFVTATTSNQVLTITAESEAAGGVVKVTDGLVGSIFIKELPSSDILAVRGKTLVSGTSWNQNAPGTEIIWSKSDLYDDVVFSHSTTTSAQEITINQAGDYLLVYNDSLFSSAQRSNPKISFLLDGVPVTGAEVKSHYIVAVSSNNTSSGSTVFLLEGVEAGQILTVRTEREGNAGTVSPLDDAMLLLWKKVELNLRPEVTADLGVPFDNIRFASTTPFFEFKADDPDGTSKIEYEFSISTSSNFISSTTKNSNIDSGFEDVILSTTTSPFVENNKVRFSLSLDDKLENNTTYFWRVRAKDVFGSNEFGDWSTTQSLTVDLLTNIPGWLQTKGEQFSTNDLVLTTVDDDSLKVDATLQSEVMSVYGEGTVATPKYRFWDGAFWSSEQSALSVGGTVNWIKNLANPVRNEYMMATINSLGVVNAQIYTASTSVWSDLTEVSTVPNATYRGMTIAYESLSGKGMVVSCDGTNASYRIWDGISWSATSSIPLSKAADCRWLESASNPTSNEILLAVKHTRTGTPDYEVLVWDGSSWGNSNVLRDSNSDVTSSISVSYNKSGTQGMVVVDGVGNGFSYTIWDGTSWTIPANNIIGTRIYSGNLVSSPFSDVITLCAVTATRQVQVLHWKGTGWSSADVLSSDANEYYLNSVNCAYETIPGRAGNLLVTYNDRTQSRYKYYNGTSWSSELSPFNVGRVPVQQLVRAGDGKMVTSLVRRDLTRNIYGSVFNGTDWSDPEILEVSPSHSSTLPREVFFLAPRRFSEKIGTATTKPIQFNLVENQNSWGDVVFNTIEPLGTAVKVRLKYNNIGTCDSYVPDVDLPGNDLGFTRMTQPINISILSTTTYSTICLEAKLSSFGTNGSGITDWQVTWERLPRLTQSNYRWFVNGSFLTPNDPWPAGITDLTEKTAITSEEAISIGESVRLRMSLLNSNVDFAQFKSGFKLQYAEGNICTADLFWEDVATTASTTAKWRGYENAIVGDDWLNESWRRRIKITIDHTLVKEDVVDFPVYVNLGNLPQGFFNNVKSSGGDIRVTKADGMTELPFDLVSIDTSTRTGELHFKTSLSTTTDGVYFIYYDNPSAVAYSPSATYGSEKVWTNNYDLRFSLKENPNDPSPQFKDSSSNKNNATKLSGAGALSSANLVAGKIGNGISFNAGNHGASFSKVSFSGSYTISMWWNTNNTGFAINSGYSGSSEKIGPWNSGNIFTRVLPAGVGQNTIPYPSHNDWHLLVFTRGADNKVDMTVDGGTPVRLFGDVAQVGVSNWAHLGGDGGQRFRGVLDEVRLSSVKRSDGWNKTEFNNQSSPGSFYDVSNEELISNGKSLPSTLLSDSDFAETYVEQNPTRENQNLLAVGEKGEWDFVLQNNAALANMNYCFRVVYENGTLLQGYEVYPRLITNAPPLKPNLSMPFDNEKASSTSPSFRFAADDELDDDVSYIVQIDTNNDFSDPVIEQDSGVNFALFTNLSSLAQKGTFSNGQTIEFVLNSNLQNNTTYYWRVRAYDPNGSGGLGEWSEPYSFTTDSSVTVSTWYQSEDGQFSTNELENTKVNLGGGEIRLNETATSGKVYSTDINFNDGKIGNAWGNVSFVQSLGGKTIKYFVEYKKSNTEYALVPDGDLSGNSSGFITSPINITTLDPAVYKTIRIVAVLSGDSSYPRLQSWQVEWTETISVPDLISPFDNALINVVKPKLFFVSSDPDGDDIEYEVQIDDTIKFTAPDIFNSGVDIGFQNTETIANPSPFNGNEKISYSLQTDLIDGETYFWRVRSRDPNGDNIWSKFSKPHSFTIDTEKTVSAWHQTIGEQFMTDVTDSIEPTANGAQINSVVNGMLTVFGQNTEVSPRYSFWNGSEWSESQNALIINTPSRWIRTKAAPNRSEFALGIQGNVVGDGTSLQIYNAETNLWGNLVTLNPQVTSGSVARRGFDIAYESQSGKLVAVACDGTGALYRTWNGTSWSATSSIAFDTKTNCQWVKLISNPEKNEIIATFQKATAGNPDFEALVWNGSSWGKSIEFANNNTDGYETMSSAYNRAGSQAIVVAQSGGTTVNYAVWNGSSWSTPLPVTVPARMYWGDMVADPYSSNVSLCFVNSNSHISVVTWDGAAWNTPTTLTTTANSVGGKSVSCQYETTSGREGNLMVVYSDTNFARYQYSTSSPNVFSGEMTLDTIEDSWTATLERGADGMLHTVFFDDVNDRHYYSNFDGSTWSEKQAIGGVPTVTNTPFDGTLDLAAQIVPSFTNGSIRSTTINFSDGGSPRFEKVTFVDSTPSGSKITYQVYYENNNGEFVLIPDVDLPGNSLGFTESPIDISNLDTSFYKKLQLDAQLECDNGICPTIEEWTVEWSEGISISGLAFENDNLTALSEGMVAIAVNGVLQTGKTADISGSFGVNTLSFNNAGDSTFKVPVGVTNLTVKAWGAGGGAGAGGLTSFGGDGAGGGFVQGDLSVVPNEDLTVKVGGGGEGGKFASPAGAGGGGGLSGVFRTSTPLAIAGAGGGGAGGTGGIGYVGAGVPCEVNARICTPAIPDDTEENDILIAVVYSRVSTNDHTCTSNCSGWTEFSGQDIGNGRLSVWHLRQGASVPGAPTFEGPTSNNTFIAKIWAFRGVKSTGSPFDVMSTNTTQAANLNYIGSNLVSTVDNTMSVFVGASLDDNEWGVAGGACTFPDTASDTEFYHSTGLGSDASVFMCFNGEPTNKAGSLGTPLMTQTLNGPDGGRWFAFNLVPESIVGSSTGAGGVGGGLSGGDGGGSGAGLGGTQIAGGLGGGGSPSGSALAGGAGKTAFGGGSGGLGGVNGGGKGGDGKGKTAEAGGGGGGGGYFGGGAGATSQDNPSGGGGGSSYIENSALATSTFSASGTDAGNNSDIGYGLNAGMGGSSLATSTDGEKGKDGRVVLSWTGSTTPGVWTIPNINVTAGDIITVFVENADGEMEAVAVTKYDGIGDVTGMRLAEKHLVLGSDDAPTLSNLNLGAYQNNQNEDVFFSVTGGELDLCVESTCSDSTLHILSGTTYKPEANGKIVNLKNEGDLLLQNNKLKVAGNWVDNGTFNLGNSHVVFTATSGQSVIENNKEKLEFFNLTFGETSGSAVWKIEKNLQTNGNLVIDYGSLNRGTSSLSLSRNLQIGLNGDMTGIGTTTFIGNGSYTWGDAKPKASSTNVGNVIVDGTIRTVTLSGNVGAESIIIGSDDTLNSSGSNYNINVVGAWQNNNAFIPQNGTITFVGTSTNIIKQGASSFNNLNFVGVGGNWSFSTSTLVLNGDLNIATGTVTLPSGTTSVAGSFTNDGGVFLHNNGEVKMTSNASGKTIKQNTSEFLNHFYNLSFTGTGAWSFVESSTTVDNNFLISAGSVTLPSGEITVGGDYTVNGGTFIHNNGTVKLLVKSPNNLKTNGSAFNNLLIAGSASDGWYNDNWKERISLTIPASSVESNLSNFPVFLDLADLGDGFFSGVKSDGSDIRITGSDGTTEVPIEVVSVDKSGKKGEVYFRASSLSSTVDNSFFVYYKNASSTSYAVTDTYGARNVWSNNYAIVNHMNDLSSSVVLNSAGTINGNKTASNNPAEVNGYINKAQDFGANSINYTGSIISGLNEYGVSMWFKADSLVGTGDNATYGFSLFGVSQSGSNYNWLALGGGAYASEVRFCAYTNSSTCDVSSGAGLSTSTWNYISANAYKGATTTVRLNDENILSYNNVGTMSLTNDFTLGDLRPGRGINIDGIIDEVRVSKVARSVAWQKAEYKNTAKNSFYQVGSVRGSGVRNFVDNTNVLGNLSIDTIGKANFPTGTLTIGGSFLNSGKFENSSGTVKFNSNSGSETVNAGNSVFATLEFDNVGGDFTLTENATSSIAVKLLNASQFTLAPGKKLTVLGSFDNNLNPANTTWSSSTLIFANTEKTLNSKASLGDDYGTILADGVLVKMWNSSASDYQTSGTYGSVYSQNHGGANGELYIWGNYYRGSGTEYWSYAKDFDGADLVGGNERAVFVKIASSSKIKLENSSLNFVGGSSSSSTVSSQSGKYSLESKNSTLTAKNFIVENADENGFALLSSSTLATFEDGLFKVSPTSTGITIDSSTIDKNASTQLFRIGFATSSVGTAYNVSKIGTTTAYVWFRDGFGNLYGEDYDNNDANPGSIRFDDSSNTIAVSGKVFADDGVTSLGAPVCDNVTTNVHLIINNGSSSVATACNSITGAYSFPTVSFVGDAKMTVYLDTDGGAKGSVVTKTPTVDITNLDIYQNRVIVRHEDVLPVTIADLELFDNTNDSDLSFKVESGDLILSPNTELFVFASSTFKPEGNITLTGNGNSNNYEGTLQLGEGAKFIASTSETHTLAGSLILRSGTDLQISSSNFIFNATTSGKSVSSANKITFGDVKFVGENGGWHLNSNLEVLGDMEVNEGTVTGTGDIVLKNGEMTGDGLVSLGGGEVVLSTSNTFGGNTAWTFHDLTLGDGNIVGTTTPPSTLTTVAGKLTINDGHVLEAGNSQFDLAGTGEVLVERGVLQAGTSTFRFSGSSAEIPATVFYNLHLDAGAGSGNYVGDSEGILVLNDLVIGENNLSVFDLETNEALLQVEGNVVIKEKGNLKASVGKDLVVFGNWTNEGAFISNGGLVKFVGNGTSYIEAGNSSFGQVEIDGDGSFLIAENATTTDAFSLINHSNFTVASGKTLALGGEFVNTLGGSATTFTGSNLTFFGNGTYEINASTTSDVYETIATKNGAQVRMWNSEATSYLTSAGNSIYSQNHKGVLGDLYIFGDLVKTEGNDYWSYATDFDGSDLSGGSERVAQVFLAENATVTFVGSEIYAKGENGNETTIQNQGAGKYSLAFGSSTKVNFNRVQIRDIDKDGVVFFGTPIVTDFSYTDHLVTENNASAMTVGGTAINANEAKNFTNNTFAVAGGVSGASNVTATGTALSSWRFTNHLGNLAGEDFDNDPEGDPGLIVWDDSAALITVSGKVYSDEGVTVSSVCDGTTQNIRLVVAGLTTYNTSCNASSGAYSISNVAFSPLDTLTLYISGESEKAANVSISPISSISNMNLYENRVILRHEKTEPITISNLSVWDSSDDADIIFTAETGSPDTLTLPSSAKLIIWSGKTFAPKGDVTLSGNGSGSDFAGSLEVLSNGRILAEAGERFEIGGNFSFGNGATFTSASSTVKLNSNKANTLVEVNGSAFYNLTVAGSGNFDLGNKELTVFGDYEQNAGQVDFASATSTFSGDFTVTSGGFENNNSNFIFTGAGVDKTVKFNNSKVASLLFIGTSSSWKMEDVNATATGEFLITSGAVSLPSGTLTVGADFMNEGVVTHNNANLIMTANAETIIKANNSSLGSLTVIGTGTFKIIEKDFTLAGSLDVQNGTLEMATGTTAIGGSFLASANSLTHSTGTILLSSPSLGNEIKIANNSVNNLQISSPLGGYTLYDIDILNNFALNNVGNLAVENGAEIVVGGVFTNTANGDHTNWSNSNLYLNSTSSYSINNRNNSGDVYGNLIIGDNAKVRVWYSSASSTTVSTSSSLYSQDHNNNDGHLYIYGDFEISTTTEYWNYATDFDGTGLVGAGQRQAQVFVNGSSSIKMNSGTLQIVGSSSLPTLIKNQGSGTYSFATIGGTLNANNYNFKNLDINGLALSGQSIISNLANGLFDLAVDTGSLITVSSTTLNTNPSKIFDNVGFTATSGISGFNVKLNGDTDNAWRFTNSYGNISGEGYDIDGIDACGSIRFDDSECLLIEQTNYRWRLDNGGIGVSDSEWLDHDFTYRKRIRINNNENKIFTNLPVKITVPYDAGMQSDFSDLRFTADDGKTEIPFWVEKYVASNKAIVWVRVPSFKASDQAVVNMYFGNGSVSSLSDGYSVFSTFDDFEDGNISEYSGNTSKFSVSSSEVYGGNYALSASNPDDKTTSGAYRNSQTVSQGQTFRYVQYVDIAHTSDETCTLFGVQSTSSNNYAICLEQFGTDRISIGKNIVNNDSSGSLLTSTPVTFATGWYEVEVNWNTNGDIKAFLYDKDGELVTSISVNDTTYSSGGYGFAYWFQHGAWDSITSRPLVTKKPTINIGERQESGGASWSAPLNTSSGAQPGDALRVRIAVENSGLDVSQAEFVLQYAKKGGALTCGSVSGANYSSVPTVATCGNSPVCMVDSPNVVNNTDTTDLLFGTKGGFIKGKFVDNNTNKTSGIDVDQHFFTEVEYALKTTEYADDAYCFRVTNNGTELDYYENIAELSLKYDPIISEVSLNDGQDIILTPGTTTPITVSGTVSDFNGYSDIVKAAATIYRSGAGPNCVENDNNCYHLNIDSNSCLLEGCSGNSCTLTCVADLAYFAEPTDAGDFEGQEWLAYLEAEDTTSGLGFNSAIGVSLYTMRALSVDSLINYGAIEVLGNTGSYNPTTTVENIGNSAIGVDVTGSDLSDGMSSVITADHQKVATSTFTYSSCVNCSQLSTLTPITLGVLLSKPNDFENTVDTDIYWGISVPFSASNSTHTGVNLFTAISP